MKVSILVLTALTAQLSQAANLHCDVYESAKSPFPASFDRPLSNTVGDTAVFELGALNGTKVLVSTISYGTQAHPLVADARVYIEANGIRVDGNKSILLAAPNKDVFEARCSIKE